MIVVRGIRSVNLDNGDIVSLAEIRIEITLPEIGEQLMNAPITFFRKRTPTSYSHLVSSPLYQSLWPSSVAVFPKPVHLTSSSPKISHFYNFNAWVSSFTLPHWCSVRTFHVPMDAHSLSATVGDLVLLVSFYVFPFPKGCEVFLDPGFNRSSIKFCLLWLVMILSLGFTLVDVYLLSKT